MNLGILPVQVSEQFLQKIFDVIDENNEAEFTVDLEAEEITINSSGDKESFEINPYKKTCLLNGYDDIDYILSIEDKIKEYESTSIIKEVTKR